MNIVITGGGKGIGKALALRFADVENNIFIGARTEADLKQTALEIKNKSKDYKVFFKKADLSLREDVNVFASFIKNHCDRTDILINNAGTFLPGSIYNEPEGTLESMIQNNLYSAYHLTRALLPEMIQNKQGHIFNMCSIASLNAYPNGGSYSISKYALAGFSRNLREELKPYNIRVTTVYPGAVYTDSWSASGLPEERFIKVEDIADLIYSTAMVSSRACVEELVIRPQPGDI